MSFPSSISVPPSVLAIARKLDAAGFETWCVGGAIRDTLLECAETDFDLATAAKPDEVRRLFRRTVPVGVEHGTVAVLDDDGVPHEVTTFRKDVETDGRHAVVAFGASLDEDLARRDFTINAIAYHPLRHEWRDPFDGAGDLERKLVRAVGDPKARFREDYLRIVRALRFAARFGFAIDPPTWDAAREAADGLQHLSAERIRDEWFKGLATAERPSELVRLWQEVGALSRWLPEIEPDDRVDHLPRDPVLMTSFLSREPATTLSRLRCSNAEIERGRAIGRFRDQLPPLEDAAVRRWLATVGDAADDLLLIADVTRPEDAKPLRQIVERIRASGAPLSIGDLAIDGGDVMAAGVAEGPEVGKVLRALLDEVLETPERNQKAYLLERVRELAATGGRR